jgi:predicted TIM-barrel fold metal-dependent hydrolase
MRVIALEEHFATPEFFDGPGRGFFERIAGTADDRFAGGAAALVTALSDIGDGRIAAMDNAGIDVQVLSLTSPGTERLPASDAPPLARAINDALAEAIRRNPDRFGGFAALPTADPVQAATELERVVSAYGFVGANINGHCQGRRLDDQFFWPILERAEALRVPLYIHPTPPPEPVASALYGGEFAPGVSEVLASAGWGWHIETAIHVLRLIFSGAFDRFPKLQLIIGHMGEVLPFMLPRLDHALPTSLTKLQQSPSEYLRRNVHYTFSGFNWTPTFLELILQVGADRTMFSSDYPYASMTAATDFLKGIPVSPSDRERIAHGNAEHLLRV